jgi:hypothetical protein
MDYKKVKILSLPNNQRKFAAGGITTDPPAWIGPGAGTNPYVLPPLEIRSTPNRPPYNNVTPYNTGPTPTVLMPGFNEDLAYQVAKNKLRLRQQLESGQLRNLDNPGFFEFLKNGDQGQAALEEMYRKYPDDKRLVAKEDRANKETGEFLIKQGLQRFAPIPKPLSVAYDIFTLPDQLEEWSQAQRDSEKEYGNYTEELKNNVDTYEKAHGTYKPGLFERLKNLGNPQMRRIDTPAFSDGGPLPKAQYGKQKKIIEVDSEDDPRIQAEADSSTIALATNNMIQHLQATPNANAWMQYSNNWYNKNGANSPFAKAFSRLTRLNKRKPSGMLAHSLLPGGGNFPQTAVQYIPPQTHVVVRPPAPKMIEPKPLPIPGIPIAPQLQNIPDIEYTGPRKQRVIVNTPQGDMVRVQDLDTKQFLNWEDAEGMPLDFSGMPTGTPSQDFPEVRRSYGKFANGGDISVPDLRRVKIHSLPNNWKTK